MPTTANLAMPYPALTAAPNVPADIQALADRVDTVLTTPPSAWVTPALLNSWVAFGAPHQALRYRKINGVVYVQGFVKNGVGAAATIIVTLPAGFRPAATITSTQTVGPGPAWTGARVDVDSAGNVQIGQTLGSTSYLGINLVFPADA